MKLAVNGTLMRGLELSENMEKAGAVFLEEAKTSPDYFLFSINDKYPAMVKMNSEFCDATSVDVEVWEISASGLCGILENEPAGLTIGNIALENGERVFGVIAEQYITIGQKNITNFKGWRKYISFLEENKKIKNKIISKNKINEVMINDDNVDKIFVKSEPYNWPYDFNLKPENTALIIIDMQKDFCGKGGYVDGMGYDLSLTQAPILPISRVLSVCRKFNFSIFHTREGHRPDESDLPPNKKWRSKQIGSEIGSEGPLGRILIRGSPGWDIIPELYPIKGEPVIDKPGKGSFYATDLDLLLKTRGIKNIILCGITTDVCVHTTMREANDKGYECLLLSDCTGATDYGNHLSALKMIKMQGGVFGAVSDSHSLVEALTTHYK